jgi:predicted dehydrogenase
MEKIRLGLIGLGYIGKIHLRHCQKLANTKLVATVDLSKKALKTAKDMGVKKTYTDYKQLLKDPEINAELQHFVNCLIKDKQPTPTGEDGLKDLEAIEKAYKNQIITP